MPTLHDAAHRGKLATRLQSLRPDSTPKWGVMRVDQMLWHVNTALDMALGRVDAPRDKLPLPLPIMRFMVINLPWPKSAPTNPSLRATGNYDFGRERETTLKLVNELGRKELSSDWGDHPLLGRMSEPQVIKLQAKHLDHHLRQFGV